MSFHSMDQDHDRRMQSHIVSSLSISHANCLRGMQKNLHNNEHVTYTSGANMVATANLDAFLDYMKQNAMVGSGF